MSENPQALTDIILSARDPISEQFSVKKMDRLRDVYLNPFAQGDFLKAITQLPISTNSDETANPSLRGSSPDRSRVALNGVPIYNPVRATNLNNQGFFSLFNTEIIQNEYVYASNPPLTYGNTTAGLIEIQTSNILESNQLQFSIGLLNTGFLWSQKLNKDSSFIQIYSNYLFSDAFVSIQKKKLPDIKNFYTKDAGLNYHAQLNKKIEFNSYSYFMDETFKGFSEQFSFRGIVNSKNRRFFVVNNLKFVFKAGILSINNGISRSNRHYDYGILNSKQRERQVYASIDFKRIINKNINIQIGASYDSHNNTFDDRIPTYFYALSNGSPFNLDKRFIQNSNLENYLFSRWDLADSFFLFAGIRSNFLQRNQKFYMSSQMGLKFKMNGKQSFSLSGGTYYNYSIPNFSFKEYNLLSSSQMALDYNYKSQKTLVKAAGYFKKELGGQESNFFLKVDNIKTFGLEFFMEHQFNQNFKFSFSNSYVDQKITIYDKKYNGQMDFNFFIKSSIQYINSNSFSTTLSYLSRPGIPYTSISGSTYEPVNRTYIPNFSNDFFDSQYGNYHRLDLSLSRFFQLKKNAMIVFLSLNNILNLKNDKTVQYNFDYSLKSFESYQLRSLYFGMVFQLGY